MSAGGVVLPEEQLLRHHIGCYEWPDVPEDDRISTLNLDDVVWIDTLPSTHDTP